MHQLQACPSSTRLMSTSSAMLLFILVLGRNAVQMQTQRKAPNNERGRIKPAMPPVQRPMLYPGGFFFNFWQGTEGNQQSAITQTIQDTPAHFQQLVQLDGLTIMVILLGGRRAGFISTVKASNMKVKHCTVDLRGKFCSNEETLASTAFLPGLHKSWGRTWLMTGMIFLT